MKSKRVINKLLKSPATVGWMLSVLVLSLGLLCASPPGRGRGAGVSVVLGNSRWECSSVRGLGGFGVVWSVPSGGNRFHVEPLSRLPICRYSILGFRFGFSLHSVRGSDYIMPPHIGICIPLWLTSLLAAAILLLCWRVRRSAGQGGTSPELNNGMTVLQHWWLTCSLSFALAEVCWLCSRYVKKVDALEIPLGAPLLPIALLLDFQDAGMRHLDWLPFAVVFWIALFCLSGLLSRRRIHPARAMACLVGLACLFGVLVVFMVG